MTQILADKATNTAEGEKKASDQTPAGPDELAAIRKKYEDAMSEVDTLRKKLENRPEVTEAEPAAGLPSLTGKFKPDRGEPKNKNGYFTRTYNGRQIHLKEGDDIPTKIKQLERGL